MATGGIGAQERDDRFLVGVATYPYNAIIPFASFDGTRWHTRWGAPSDGEPGSEHASFATIPEIPIEWWGNVGVQTSWELVLVDGERRNMTVVGIMRANLGSGCAQNLGLAGDLGLAGRLGPNVNYTLAATAPGAVAAVEIVKEGSRDWKAIAALLPQFFNRARRPNADGRVPQSAAPLPKLEAATLAAGPRGEFIYFESTRQWRLPLPTPSPKAGQYYEQFEFPTIVQGWLWRPDPLSRFQLVRTEAFDADFLERKGSDSFLPRGVVRAQGREYWLGVLTSYAESTPVVFDVSRGGVRRVLAVGYSGC